MKKSLCLYGAVIAALGVAPSAFADVTLNATGEGGKVLLSWTATEPLYNVQVMRDTDENPIGRQRVASLISRVRAFTDRTAVSGTPYWYWIKYTDATGHVKNSNAASVSAGGNGGGGGGDSTVAVTGVTLTAASSIVKVGGTTSLVATVQPANASNKSLVWSSSNTSVATVSNTGVVTGLAKGSATITVKTQSGNATASVGITVEENQPMTIPVASVSVTQSATIKVGATANLSATVQPATATNKAVTWSSSNTSVATVSATGEVKGVAKGNATITVTTADGNKTATSAITVEENQPTTIPVTGVSVTQSATIKVGATANLSATVQPATATNKAVTWSSSNTSVATVSASGEVKGVAKGSATITVATADGNKTATSAITVEENQPTTIPVTGVSVTPNATVNVGATATLSATVAPANATNKAVSWSSGNTSVATVSANGLVTGVAKGSATITVTTADGNRTAASTVTVNAVDNGNNGGNNGNTSGCNATALPLVIDGATETCRVTTGEITKLNSWNTQLVEINGVAFTNTYWDKWAGKLPEKVNGAYTIRFVGKYGWSHLEVDGSGGSSDNGGNSGNDTPKDSTVSAGSTSFDKNTAKQADISVVMALNGNTLSAIKNGGAALASGTDYTVSGNTVVLLKSYLAKQAKGTLSLTFDFNAGNDPVLSLSIVDTTGTGGNVPAAPTGLGATVIDNGAVTLAWTDKSTNETGFRVERQLSGTMDWIKLADTPAGTQTYRDSSVEMGKAYVYRVTAFNDAGNSTAITTLATLLTLKKYGEQQYKAQACNVCHGDNGQGGLKPLEKKYTAADLSAITATIAATMPDKDGKCQGNCAAGTATYLIDIMNQGGNDTPNCAGNTPPSTRSLRLLTRQEYQNTVNDLLGLKTSLINTMPQENRVDGFDNNIATNLVTSIRLEAFLTQAQSLAAQAVKSSFNAIVPCNTQDTACATKFIQTFGKKAYRRPLTTAEQNDYLAVFSKNGFNAAVELSIAEMLASPHFLYRSELGEKQSDGTYRLTPYEVATSLSYLFLGSLPDDALFQAADKNELATTEQQMAQATRLLALPRARQQVGNFVGQWLLSSSPYTLPDKDMGVYPKYAGAKASMSDELINFFNYVTFDSTQKFPELFSANYVVADKTLADYYGLNGGAANAVTKVPVTNGTRMGIMTLGAVLSRYANSNESHPFKRGGFLYKRLLCDDLPFPANAGIVKAPKPDPNATTRERFDFHSKSGEVCWSCHKFLDAPGFGFENYDGAGQYRATENGRPIDATGIVLGLETYTEGEQNSFSNLGDLSQLVANSPNASQCVARQYYRFTTGKREVAEDECALNTFLDGYKASGYNLKTMLLNIVKSPGFTVRRAN
jgi:uncharacterized protein YjdB